MELKKTVLFNSFDSDHYGIKIGKLDATVLAQGVDAAREILSFASGEGYQLLFTRVNASHQSAKDTLAALGIIKAGALVTSKLEFKNHFYKPVFPKDIILEEYEALADENDIEKVAEIASTAFNLTHLAQDKRLPVGNTQRLYADWAKNDCTGRAKRTVLARIGPQVVGFICLLINQNSLEFQDKSRGIIDLIAVDSNYRGRGIGTILVQESLWWFAHNVQVATVGTEPENTALSLYQKYGLTPYLTQDDYHVWLDEVWKNR